MGLARHHDLERRPRSDPGQPVEVAEDQHRPLVAGHAPREAKDGRGGIEGYASERLDSGDEAAFGGLMAPPDLVLWQLEGAHQDFRLMLPLWEMRLIQAGEGRSEEHTSELQSLKRICYAG